MDRTTGTRFLLLATLASSMALDLHAEVFVAPSSGTLYIQCVGGSAGASSQVGTGTSIATFVSYLSSLPQSCPGSEVAIGAVTAGQTVPFGIHTLWGGNDYWAFSTGSDQASLVSFTDMNSSLGMSGKIIQPTGPNTWVMHLNDAAHYTISSAEANNILIRLRLAAQPGCDASSLSGAYGYALTGFIIDNQGSLHLFSASGRVVADGKGNLIGRDTVSQDGSVTRGRTYSAAYTVNSDCTGSLTLGFGGSSASLDFVLTNGGSELAFVQTDTGANITGVAKRQ